MNILVVGLGSMGKRRIRLLQQYASNNSVSINIVGIDSKQLRREEVENLYGISTGDDLTECIRRNKFDSVFVCTSPLTHNFIIKECLNADLNIFSEINLVSDGYTEIIDMAKKKEKVLFLSSTPMFRREMMKITDIVAKQEKLVSYQYHIGQYLPDWHPWESYKDFFIGNKKTNGCREILAIEMPWIIDAFGDIESIHVQKAKTTALDIDFDDTYQLLIRHSNGNIGFIQADLAARSAIRRFTCVGEDILIKWCGTPDSLSFYDIDERKEKTINLYESTDKQSGYSDNIIENAYYDEISEFMNAILNKGKMRYSFEKDMEILKWVDEVDNR